jgi:Ca2+-binding EF-hand superfamily protein
MSNRQTELSTRQSDDTGLKSGLPDKHQIRSRVLSPGAPGAPGQAQVGHFPTPNTHAAHMGLVPVPSTRNKAEGEEGEEDDVFEREEKAFMQAAIKDADGLGADFGVDDDADDADDDNTVGKGFRREDDSDLRGTDEDPDDDLPDPEVDLANDEDEAQFSDHIDDEPSPDQETARGFADNMMDEMDVAPQDGSVSFAEWWEAIAREDPSASKAEELKHFEEMDVDRDGYISREELRQDWLRNDLLFLDTNDPDLQHRQPTPDDDTNLDPQDEGADLDEEDAEDEQLDQDDDEDKDEDEEEHQHKQRTSVEQPAVGAGMEQPAVGGTKADGNDKARKGLGAERGSERSDAEGDIGDGTLLGFLFQDHPEQQTDKSAGLNLGEQLKRAALRLFRQRAPRPSSLGVQLLTSNVAVSWAQAQRQCVAIRKRVCGDDVLDKLRLCHDKDPHHLNRCLALLLLLSPHRKSKSPVAMVSCSPPPLIPAPSLAPVFPLLEHVTHRGLQHFASSIHLRLFPPSPPASPLPPPTLLVNEGTHTLTASGAAMSHATRLTPGCSSTPVTSYRRALHHKLVSPSLPAAEVASPSLARTIGTKARLPIICSSLRRRRGVMVLASQSFAPPQPPPPLPLLPPPLMRTNDERGAWGASAAGSAGGAKGDAAEG